MALDLAKLWNFGDPAASERAFVDALATAQGDDAIILKTQIARTHGMRRDFAQAQWLLAELNAILPLAGLLARAHHALETGRAIVSAAHRPESITQHDRQVAGEHYKRAAELAREAADDALLIDAVHMLAIVEVEPSAQLARNLEALAVAQRSAQPAAKRWEASILNNIGCALHAAGRHDEALAHFTRALELRRAAGQDGPRLIAEWMVARSLRHLGRMQEALKLQHALEAEREQIGKPDRHVFEELAALYAALGDTARSARYTELAKA